MNPFKFRQLVAAWALAPIIGFGLAGIDWLTKKICDGHQDLRKRAAKMGKCEFWIDCVCVFCKEYKRIMGWEGTDGFWVDRILGIFGSIPGLIYFQGKMATAWYKAGIKYIDCLFEKNVDMLNERLPKWRTHKK